MGPQTNRFSIAYLISSRLAMRTIAPIDSGFLLNSVLLIVCLACAHANGEVNSKELLDDAAFDLEADDVEATSTIVTQTTRSHGSPNEEIVGSFSCNKAKRFVSGALYS